MSKRDELTFKIKNSLVVGSATATLVGGCIGITNPGPGRIGSDADAEDVAEDTGTDTEPVDDTEPSDTGSEDAEEGDTSSSGDTTGDDGSSGDSDAAGS